MKISEKDVATVVIVLACAVLFALLDARNANSAEKPPAITNDLMCGMSHVQLDSAGSLTLNGKKYGSYKTSLLVSNFSYVHTFGDKAEVRVTQHNRIAFRLAGESRWAACVPLIFNEDKNHGSYK